MADAARLEDDHPLPCGLQQHRGRETGDASADHDDVRLDVRGEGREGVVAGRLQPE